MKVECFCEALCHGLSITRRTRYRSVRTFIKAVDILYSCDLSDESLPTYSTLM